VLESWMARELLDVVGVPHRAYLQSEVGKQLTCSIRITEKRDPGRMQFLWTRDSSVCGGRRYRGEIVGEVVSWSWIASVTRGLRVHQRRVA
jgi:hypothetical protein